MDKEADTNNTDDFEQSLRKSPAKSTKQTNSTHHKKTNPGCANTPEYVLN